MNKSIENRAEDLLEEFNVVVPGHFVGTKGGHLDTYVQKDVTIADPWLLKEITGLMAEKVASGYEQGDIDALVGIAPCSSQLATRTAEHLGDMWGKAPEIAFAEKTPWLSTREDTSTIDETLEFKRGFAAKLVGKKVLLVEDILNTAGSLIDLRNLVSSIDDIEIKGAVVEFNRSPSRNTSESLGMSLLSLVSREMANHELDDCPMCEQGIPVRTDLGHGARFLEEQAKRR
jgi:orotate phosphoribosyltransferase